MGLEVLDTGAMYRAVTVLALRAGLDLADADKVALVAKEADLDVGERVRSHGLDLTDELTRGPMVTHQGELVHDVVKASLQPRKEG